MNTDGLLFPKPKLKKHRTEIVTDKTYNAVFERDRGRCRMCGSYMNLQLHHINR